MWTQMREVVIKNFPASPGIPANHDLYIKNIDDIYLTDAYHSLSIERYRATHEIIAKVSSGESNGKENEEDPKQRDTMAARGYYQAFLSVKESVRAVLQGKDAGIQADMDHSKWYRELFEFRQLSQTAFPKIYSTLTSMSGTDLLPKPVSRKIPALITGASQQSLEWIAKNGDGWIT